MWIPNFFIYFFFQIIMVREIRNYATLKVLYTVIDMLYFCFLTSNVTIELENKWENVNLL